MWLLVAMEGNEELQNLKDIRIKLDEKERKGECALTVMLRWLLCCNSHLQSQSGMAKVEL